MLKARNLLFSFQPWFINLLSTYFLTIMLSLRYGVREIGKNHFKLLSFEILIQGEGYLLKKFVLKDFFSFFDRVLQSSFMAFL